MKILIFKYLPVLLIILCFVACKKYLDEKPQKELVVPNSLNDLQALLDENEVMNTNTSPALGELMSDNFYVPFADWQQYDVEGNYTWAKTAIHEPSWYSPYQKSIYTSNVVLDFLPKIRFNDQQLTQYNYIKGASLFYRSFAFFQLAQIYCLPYSSTTASSPGIVLRMTSAVEVKSSRKTVEETYLQILNDLKVSVDLLPNSTRFFFQPNKCAAYGLLARTYLAMRDYTNAKIYADLALSLNSELLDYNNISPVTSNTPFFNIGNSEIIFMNTAESHALLAQSIGIIDTTLYKSYSDADLRKQVFFRSRGGAWRFKGSYAGAVGLSAASLFDGLATDELYLIRAECNARGGNAEIAMNDLNLLLKKRWKSGLYVDMVAANAEDAKNLILKERRKELIYRGLRLSDLRRFNLEGANITLTRVLDGTVYSLPLSDSRAVALIPWEEITRSGIPQNPR